MIEPTDSPTNRLFVGVTAQSMPPLDHFLSRLAELGRAVRVVRCDQLHITLKFYGNVAANLIPELIADLDGVARNADPIHWTVRGTGAFPSVRRPSVIWAGVDDGGRFAALADKIERFSGPLGFARERRAYTPHMTLARVRFRPPPALEDLLQETSDRVFGAQVANALILMQSQVGPGGSIYTPLHAAPLNAL